jgi:pyroglutamyl-peptidase
MVTVLTSGFGPFPPYAENPSWDALRIAKPQLPAGWRLARVRLDVAWNRAAETLLDYLDDDVRIVIAFGQADDSVIRVERFAVNAADRTLADIDHARFQAEVIDPAGPAAYATGLPWQPLLTTLAADGLPAIESHFAGGYLCNFIFYRLMATLADRSGVVGGFVHVPPTTRLPLEKTRSAMERIIETAVAHSRTRSAR